MAQILMFGGNFAPNSWAFCHGQILSIAQNTALFSLLGTTYGGNGQTTFALPDFRSRVPVGTGQGPGLAQISLGESSGSETTTLSSGQLPVHTHPVTATVAASSANATSDQPGGNIPATVGPNIYATPAAANGAIANANLMIQPTGAGLPFGTQQPVLGLTFIICIAGVYPARN